MNFSRVRSILIATLLTGLYLSPALAQKKVRFGLFTDLHIATMHDGQSRLQSFMDSMKTARPDFIIELGDFNTAAPKYSYGFEVWDAYPGEKYHVIGNHEMDGGTSLQQALARRNMASAYYSFEKNGFYFIVLDGNEKKTPDVKGYQEHINPAQIAWLKTELSKAKGPIVIFSHQGLGPDGIDNSEELRSILEAHNATVRKNKVIANFYGHIHYDRAEKINDIWYVCINSMSYKWLGEEYGHVRYSDEVDKNFKWIKYTAPYRDPLFTVIEISPKGTITIAGKKSVWVGPSPKEVGYPQKNQAYDVPEIRPRTLLFR